MRLGPLASKLGETERQIQRVVDEGLAPRPLKKGDYDIWATVRGVIRYYKEKAGKYSEARAVDAARKEKAEADTAEIAVAEKRKLIMLKSDARLLWADATIEVRRVIESREQWKSGELLRALSKIKPADPDEASD